MLKGFKHSEETKMDKEKFFKALIVGFAVLLGTYWGSLIFTEAQQTVIPVRQSGTGTTSFPVASLIASHPATTTGALQATSSPTIGYIFATTTTATSSFLGGLYVSRGVQFDDLVSCNTIDTDASGNLFCGTDATGAGGGDPNVIYLATGGTTYYVASSTATDNLSWRFNNGFVATASSTASARFGVYGALVASSTLQVTDLTRLFGGLNASSTATSTFAGGISVNSIGGLSTISGLTITGGNILQTNTATNTLRGLSIPAGKLS